ncbi:hypothetical protein EVAR_2874_1 [Eumeta japonica]|uniref:Uncharacterized protein n=1 Tax=Eumeta variegata TaxID=151549 RepID=A0A4C1T0L5_EUMVA|nr:hypothetical protein EVAR_2874_1 [Eumeta japonica]
MRPMEWQKNRSFRALARSSVQAERDNESHFFVRAAGVHRFIIEYFPSAETRCYVIKGNPVQNSSRRRARRHITCTCNVLDDVTRARRKRARARQLRLVPCDNLYLFNLFYKQTYFLHALRLAARIHTAVLTVRELRNKSTSWRQLPQPHPTAATNIRVRASRKLQETSNISAQQMDLAENLGREMEISPSPSARGPSAVGVIYSRDLMNGDSVRGGPALINDL